MPPVLTTSHLQLEWQIPSRSTAFEALAEGARVIHYDCRGMGMSQRDSIDFSAEAASRDLDAVADRLGLEQFDILRLLNSGIVPFAYPAFHPERVRRLVIWEGHAQDDRDPVRARQLAAIEGVLEQDWDLYVRIRARIAGGWDGSTAQIIEEILRGTHTPDSARALSRASAEADPGKYLSQISARSLVLYRAGTRQREDSARLYASQIAHARLAAVSDASIGHFPNASAIETILEFLNPSRPQPAPEARQEAAGNSLRVILFTDLEMHTAMMHRLGDEGGRAVLREHEAITREALDAYGGAEIKSIGDGFMASFGAATRALECAMAIQKAFAAHNEVAEEPLRVRIGLSAGEPIAEAEDLFGTSVILAARIADHAQGGQIMLANVVRELVAGKGFLFSDMGECPLKGFEDPVRLYELKWDQPRRPERLRPVLLADDDADARYG